MEDVATYQDSPSTATLKDRVERGTQEFQWRFEQFVGYGFDEEQAYQLAESEADHHQAKNLLDQDCPKALVVDILT